MDCGMNLAGKYNCMKRLVTLSRMQHSFSVLAWLLIAFPAAAQGDGPAPAHRACSVIEDFEAYEVGEAPYLWDTNKGSRLIPADRRTMDPGRNVVTIQVAHGNKFVRMQMNDYAYRLIKRSGGDFDWNADVCPVLSWRWRVSAFPKGGNETMSGTNDVAAAVYVTFGRDWIGRPISIKYTFSSTLPVGAVVDYGPLQVLVVRSAADGSPGEWDTIERDVVADYKRLFGESPDTYRPVAITLFSDADDIPGAAALVDFDDLQTFGRH